MMIEDLAEFLLSFNKIIGGIVLNFAAMIVWNIWIEYRLYRVSKKTNELNKKDLK